MEKAVRYCICGSSECEEWLQKNGVDEDAATITCDVCRRCRVEGPVSYDAPEAESLDAEVIAHDNPEIDFAKIADRAITRILNLTDSSPADDPLPDEIAKKIALDGELTTAELNSIGDYFRDVAQCADSEMYAVHWYAKAARKGEPWAMWRVGSVYWGDDDVPDLGHDYLIAFACFRQAAELGGADGMSWVGRCYQCGYGVEPNIPTAVDWFKRSAKLGNVTAKGHLAEIDEKIFANVVGHFSVKQLLESNDRIHFILPSYQRGYRWRQKHIDALIRDLSGDWRDAQRYSLQPIVVKKCEKGWLLVDGQQRLSTMKLLLKTIAKIRPRNEESDPRKCINKNLWKIDSDSSKQKIGSLSRLCYRNALSIFLNHKNELTTIWKRLGNIDFVYYRLDRDARKQKEDPIDTFSNLNAGRIPLTDSELIRALYMGASKSNLSVEEKNEIAAEWEQIELQLRDNTFWYMFNQKSPQSDTRIDILFRIITGTEEKTFSEGATPAFDILQADGEEKLRSRWDDLMDLYWMLRTCFADIELYHYIGWFSHCRHAKFATFQKMYSENPSGFKRKLRRIILGEEKDAGIDGLNFDHPPEDENGFYYSYEPEEDVKELLENDDYEHRREELRAFFLLLNIEYLNQCHAKMVNGCEDFYGDVPGYNRFPFDLYKEQKWHIEHISSHTPNPMSKNEDRIEWLLEVFQDSIGECFAEKCAKIFGTMDKDVIDAVVDKLSLESERKKISSIVCYDGDVSFEELYDVWSQKYANYGISDEESSKRKLSISKIVNGIGNLTLLDEGTNTSYKNAVFPRKRKRIRDVSMGWVTHEQDGRKCPFIPECTKLVFMKYFSKNQGNAAIWSVRDMTDYKEWMTQIFTHLKSEADK